MDPNKAPKTPHKKAKMEVDRRAYLQQIAADIKEMQPADLPHMFGILCETLLSKRREAELDILRNVGFGRDESLNRPLEDRLAEQARYYKVAAAIMRLMNRFDREKGGAAFVAMFEKLCGEFADEPEKK